MTIMLIFSPSKESQLNHNSLMSVNFVQDSSLCEQGQKYTYMRKITLWIFRFLQSVLHIPHLYYLNTMVSWTYPGFDTDAHKIILFLLFNEFLVSKLKFQLAELLSYSQIKKCRNSHYRFLS